MGAPFLRIHRVKKTYVTSHNKVDAISHIDLDVAPQEFVAILGPSGCGKSTLLRIIAGLEEPTEGAVYVQNRKVEGPGADRGMVFQAYTLFPWLTVRQNIEFGLELRNVPPAEREKIALDYIERIGLKGFENAYPKHLSGGMQQRVAIARALANDPSILLLDEPFGALDAQTRVLMQEMLVEVWEELRKTVVFVTHDVEEAIFLADRVLVMTARPGRIKASLSVPIPRPRAYTVKTSPEFLALKEHATELIREESLRTLTQAVP